MSDLNFDANFDEVVSFTADFGVIGSTSITVDQEVTETSSNPVASSGIYSFTTEKVGEVASAKEDKAFVCTYGTTSYADVLAAYNAGKQLILLVGVDKYYLTKVTQTNGIYTFEFSSYDSNLGLDSVRLTKTETGFSWDSDNHDSIYATKTSVNTSLATKQNTLVSGTNIKTINGQSVLGEGNLVIEGGSGGNVDDVTVNGVSVLGSDKVARVSIPTNVSSFTNDAGYITENDIPTIPSKTSDLTNDSGFITAAYVPTKTSQLTNDSDYTTTEQVAGQLDLKQDVLTAGANITISEDNVISATGGSGGSTVTMADNAQGGVDLTVDGTSKTLAKQTSVTDLNNALTTLDGRVTTLENTPVPESVIENSVDNYLNTHGGVYAKQSDFMSLLETGSVEEKMFTTFESGTWTVNTTSKTFTQSPNGKYGRSDYIDMNDFIGVGETCTLKIQSGYNCSAYFTDSNTGTYTKLLTIAFSSDNIEITRTNEAYRYILLRIRANDNSYIDVSTLTNTYFYKGIKSKTQTDVEGKVDIEQGIENVGKVLSVGEDGKVALKEIDYGYDDAFLRESKSNKVVYNCNEILSNTTPTSRTTPYNGIKYTWTDTNTCVIEGTSTASSFTNIINTPTAMPEWLIAGKKYYVRVSHPSDNVGIRFYFYSDATTSTFKTFYDDGVVEVPSNTIGINIRVLVNSGVNANGTLKAFVFDEYKAIPMLVTIIDDDTSNNTYVTRFHDACCHNGIKGTYAIMTKRILDGATSAEKMLAYEDEGFGMVAHCNYQYEYWQEADPTKFDPAQCFANLTQCKRDLKTIGFANADKYWVTPGGHSGKYFIQMAKTLGFDCLIALGQTEPMYANHNDKYFIPRSGLATLDTSLPNTSLAGVKEIVDKLVEAKTGWLIICTHFNDWENGGYVWDETLDDNGYPVGYSRFNELVQYIIGTGCKIVPFSEAFANYEMVFDYNKLAD